MKCRAITRRLVLFISVLLAIATSLPVNEGQASVLKDTTGKEGSALSRPWSGRSGTDGVKDTAARYREGEVLVKFKASVTESAKQAKHRRLEAKVLREHKGLRLHRVGLKKGMTVEAAIEQYRRDPDVEYAEPNYLVKAQAVPNDPYFGELWGLAKIQAPAAWDVTTGSDEVVVAIIDTGIDYTHPELVGNLWVNSAELGGEPGVDNDGNGYVGDIYGYNASNDTGDPWDDYGHGTHVAGTIGAVGNNGAGVAGVAWNTKLMACKFLDDSGRGSAEDAIECLQYVKTMKSRGVNIVATSNSWGSDEYSQALYDAIRDTKDILFVAAAGNDDTSAVHYPSGYDLPNIISVAASDDSDAKASFSNFNRWTVDIAAPGVDILSTVPGGDYAFASGTSMATPHVTGLAALLKAQDPSRNTAALKNLILSGGDDLYSFTGLTTTGKRINAYKSLTCTDSPLISVVHLPDAPQPGVPVTVSVMSVNCGRPVGPVSLTLSGGATVQLLDDGLAPDEVAGDGVFTGKWTPTGTSPQTLSFRSPAGTTAVSTVPVTIGGTPSTLPPAVSLPNAVTSAPLNAPFSMTFSTSGGAGPFTWSVLGPGLPAGLAIDSATGEISGIPTAAGLFPFKLQVADSLGVMAWKDWTLLLNDGLRPGWPKELQQKGGISYVTYPASPVITDLDGDGKDEIVVADGDTLYVFYADGTSKKTVVAGKLTSPAVADLDGDGRKEIVVSVNDIGANPIYAFHSDLTAVPGFPAGGSVPYNVSSPIVGDFNNDGKPRIAILAAPDYTGNRADRKSIHMVDSSGNLVPGWPQEVGENNLDYTPPSFGDIDHDGKMELVYANTDGLVRIFRPDGTLLNQWQLETGTRHSGAVPLLADLDQDGNLDLVMTYGDSTTPSQIGVFTAGGVLLPGWPRRLPYYAVADLAVADVDGDGALEVIAVNGPYRDELHVFKGDGSYLSGWPVSLSDGSRDVYGSYGCHPVVADIDGDGKQEVFFTATDGKYNGLLFGYAANGAPLPGFPKYASPASDIASAAAVGDFDGNGRLDLVVKSENGYLYAWEAPQSVAVRDLQWPMYRKDPGHSATVKPRQLLVDPPSYNFGPVAAGATSAAVAFTVANPLRESVVFSSLSVTGADSSLFAVAGGSCGSLPVSLSQGQSCTFSVTFSPSTAGTRSALLTVGTTTPGVTSTHVVLAGRSPFPPVALTYTRAGNGGGTVVTSTGNSYSESGMESIEGWSVVTLTATPADDSTFSGWSGCDKVSGAVCTVTVSTDRNPVATFTRKPLNVRGLVYGRGAITPASATVPYGGSITFTLAPAANAYVRSFTDNGQSATLTPASGNTFSYTLSNVTVDHVLLADLVTPPAVTAIAAGKSHTLALADDGTVWAWGLNSNGQLGDGTKVNRSSAVKVAGLTEVIAIAAGHSHSLAVKRDGTVWGWGGNTYGQLGDGTTTSRTSPVQVVGLSGVAGVRAGSDHSLARKSDGTLWSWGGNASGQLGDGTSLTRLLPVQVMVGAGVPLTEVSDMASASLHSIALRADRTIWTWGNNNYGQLGNGTTNNAYYAGRVTGGFSDIVAVASGTSHTVAIDNGGAVWGWGSNANGQVVESVTTTFKTPVAITALSGVAAVSAGYSHTVALKADGTVWAWGYNYLGQLGDGSRQHPSVPLQVAELSGVTALSSGMDHVVALTGNNMLWAWGVGSSGELGDGTTSTKSTRALVQGVGNRMAPLASITGTPATPTNAAGATLSVGGSGVVSYRYRLNGGPYNAETPVGTPITLSSLSDGTQVLAVIGKDIGGNWQPQPTTTGWWVDVTPPTATVSGAPATPTNATSLSLTVGGTEVAYYRYRLDSGSYSAVTGVWSAIALNNLTQGTHTVSVIGQDQVGNWQVDPTTVSWTVDLTAPSATLTGAPAAYTKATSATITVGGAEVGTYKYKLDAGAWSAERSTSTSISLTGLSQGSHTLSVIGKDAAGNWQSTAGATVASWVVDLTAPVTTPSPGAGPIAAGANVTLSCSDGTGSGCATTRYCLGAGCTPATIYSGAIAINATTDLRFYSSDQAGNNETVKTASYTLPPDYAVNVTVTGSGAGTVTSTPAGISTGSGASARFSGGSTVTLKATAQEFSVFSGWTGACSGTGDCILSMTGDRAATATFSLDLARSTYTGSGVYSPTIQGAFETAVDSDVVRMWGVEFVENILFNREKKTTIRGGFNEGYTAQVGRTVLRGSVRISGGTVNIDRLAIR